MRHTICALKKEAEAVTSLPELVEHSRLCPQSWHLLMSMTEEELWQLVLSGCTEERRAVLGKGPLTDELVAQLPRATQAELDRQLIYLDWIERAKRRWAYVGSGKTGARLVTYERAKQLANVGLVQNSSIGISHLETGLHEDADMHLRLILSFVEAIPADHHVLCEGIMGDFLQSIDKYAPATVTASWKRPFLGRVCGGESAYAASVAACHPERREIRHMGLNHASPLRQGSGKMPGNIWGNWWSLTPNCSEEELMQSIAEAKEKIAARHHERVANSGGRCVACQRAIAYLGWAGTKSAGKFASRKSPFELASELSDGKAACRTCCGSWARDRSAQPTAEEEREWVRQRTKAYNGHSDRYHWWEGEAQCTACETRDPVNMEWAQDVNDGSRGGTGWFQAKKQLPDVPAVENKPMCMQCGIAAKQASRHQKPWDAAMQEAWLASRRTARTERWPPTDMDLPDEKPCERGVTRGCGRLLPIAQFAPSWRAAKAHRDADGLDPVATCAACRGMVIDEVTGRARDPRPDEAKPQLATWPPNPLDLPREKRCEGAGKAGQAGKVQGCGHLLPIAQFAPYQGDDPVKVCVGCRGLVIDQITRRARAPRPDEPKPQRRTWPPNDMDLPREKRCAGRGSCGQVLPIAQFAPQHGPNAVTKCVGCRGVVIDEVTRRARKP